MPASTRIAAACLALGPLFVIATPCPTAFVAAARAHHAHVVHAAHGHHVHHADVARARAIEARCPCGCDERSTAASAGPGRPGASLPPAVEDPVLPDHDVAVWVASAPRVRRVFPLPDPIPI